MLEEVGRRQSIEGILFTEDADQSGCVETSRITINTHTSLLNIDDEDDEEEEELLHNSRFVVIDGEEERPPSPTHPLCRPCFKVTKAITPKHSILDRMTESFMDSFCFSQANNNDHHSNSDDLQRSSSAESEHYQLSVQKDLFDMLQCSTHPSTPELQFLWNGLFCNASSLLFQRKASPPPKRPQHRTYRQRALKVRRLREERGDVLRSSPISVLQTRSFDTNMLRQHDLNKKARSATEFMLTPQKSELGYDSDPDEIAFSETSSSFSHDISPIMEHPASLDNVPLLVQESFNINWDLKLHPSDGGHPTAVRVWLEKGTIIHQEPYMLEPSHVETTERKQTAPPAATQYMPHHEEVFTFEASNVERAKHAMARWKHCIARFAMLAVMEDVRAIQREFFHKAPATSMLVPDYNDDLDDC